MVRQESTKWVRILFSLLSVILLVALIVFSYALWKDVEKARFSALSKHNQTLISQSRSFFDHQTRLIVKTVQPRFISEGVQKRSLENVFSYLLSATNEAAMFALISTEGELLARQGEMDLPRVSSQSQDIIHRAAESRTAQIGYLHRSGLLGEPMLPFYVPILDKDKQVIALTVAFYRLQGKRSLIDNFASDTDHTLWLLGEKGQVRLTYPVPQGILSDLFGWQISEQSADLIQENLNLRSEANGMTLELKGESVLAIAGYLPEYQLVTLTTFPQKQLFSLWLQRMQPIGVIFILFIVAALLGYRIAIKVSRKIFDERAKAEGTVRKLSRAIEQSPNSVVITDSNWNIEYTNSHFDLNNNKSKMRSEASGHNITEFPPYNILAPELETITHEIALGGTWFGERKTEFDGKWYSFSISHILNPNGDITHYVTLVQDISSRKLAEAELYKQANFDPLTGLPNRRRAHKSLTKELQKAWKEKRNVAVLYLDIDNFKVVNDTFGHLIGDQLLQLVAERLARICRKRAQICHISGDEFLIYTSYTAQADIENLTKKILNDVQTPVMIEGKQLFVTVSIGVSRYPEDSNDVVGLMKFSDTALYESKRLGRNRYCFFDQDLNQRIKRRHTVEVQLRQALEKQEIHMVYQSKNDINTGQIIGFEALMRWNNSALGAVGPDEFISIAEDIGMIDQLGEYALREACNGLKQLQTYASHTLKMAVNLSIQQLNDDAVISMVDQVIRETGIDPAVLELEITESLLAESMDQLLPRLERLLAMGVSLSIDDFGTGYSSLSYLTSVPAKTLKVDRAFVKDMATNQNDATLTHTIITMAHALKMQVVAEGIEDRQQLQMLKDYGCDIGQGYLFSKPLPQRDMETLLETEFLPDSSVFKGFE